MIRNLIQYHDDLIDAFLMEFSKTDIKSNPEAKKLARWINKQGKIIDKILKLYSKI